MCKVHIMCPFPITFGTLCISRYTSIGLFLGGQRIGGGFGTDDRKRVHGGSCGKCGDHAADAEMRPEQVPELIMRLESFQESAGRRETDSFHDARIRLSLSSFTLLFSFCPRFRVITRISPRLMGAPDSQLHPLCSASGKYQMKST